MGSIVIADGALSRGDKVRFWIILALAIFLFFLFPIMGGLSWPSGFDPNELGQFFYKAWQYWVTLFRAAFGK